MTTSASFSDDVFLNCPFDDAYAEIFEAIIFAIFACGFRARSARELDDNAQVRIDKLYHIIEECRYGIHDLSRTELDSVNGLPRFNMPLELGLDLGARRYGNEDQKSKRCLILDVEAFRHQKFISDLAGMDIHHHGGSPKVAMILVRNWLANVSRRKILGPQTLIEAFERFSAGVPETALVLGFGSGRIPYVDYEQMVVEWLVGAPPNA